MGNTCSQGHFFQETKRNFTNFLAQYIVLYIHLFDLLKHDCKQMMPLCIIFLYIFKAFSVFCVLGKYVRENPLTDETVLEMSILKMSSKVF